MRISSDGVGWRTRFARMPVLVKVLAAIVIAAVAVFGWNYYDVMWWIQWYRIVEKHGVGALLRIYDLCTPPECKVPYPPLAVLMFVSVYAPTVYLPPILRIMILKAVLVIVPGLITFKILKEVRDRSTALLWLLCIPFLQIVLALQFDVLIALFVMLSTYMIIKGRVRRAALYLALATMIKHVIAVLVPIHMLFLWLLEGRKHVVKYLAVYVLVTVLISAPFFILAPKGFITNLVIFHSARVPQDLSLWAIPTLLLEDRVSIVRPIIGNAWVATFILCNVLLMASMAVLVKKRKVVNPYGLLPLYTSVTLLLYIALNKVGNLNYLVWFVPTAFMILNKKHIRHIYMLTAIAGAVCALLYALMFYAPPAATNNPMFIAEDVAYWNARALIAQSLNHYIFYPSSHIYVWFVRHIAPIFTPTDFVSEVSVFGHLYYCRVSLMLFAIALAQIVLTTMIVLMIKWVESYAGNVSTPHKV